MSNTTTIVPRGVMPLVSRRNRVSIPTQGRIGLIIEEAASYTGIGRNTIRQLVAGAKFPF